MTSLQEKQSPYQANKVFIIGLPRTGTTSVSIALLEHGYSVAHQAFTKAAFEAADIVSDAPCFSDYQQLDKLFPNAKFVYLDRALDKWVPSMQMLLERMLPHLDATTGRFHPILKRSFQHSFHIHTSDNVFDEQHLIDCYQSHQQQVYSYFAGRKDFLSIDISQPSSLMKLMLFIGIKCESDAFPHVNKGRNVASWDEYKHPNKISANLSGADRRKFFDYQLD